MSLYKFILDIRDVTMRIEPGGLNWTAGAYDSRYCDHAHWTELPTDMSFSLF